MKTLSVSLAAGLLISAMALPASAASLINLGSSADVSVGATTGASTTTAQVGVGLGTSVSTFSSSSSTSVNASGSTSGGAVVSAADVNTEDDLNAFAQSNLQADSNLKGINFDADDITVDYKDQGHLIGFIPVSVKAQTTVDSQGNVTVNYPWYDFLVAKHGDELQADLQAKVGDMIRSNGNVTWTNQDKAEVAARLAAALKAHMSVGATTSTSAATY